MKPPILSERDIELRAEEMLAEYERQSGKRVDLPVPIENVAMQVLNLPVQWESLGQLSGARQAVSKLCQPRYGVPPSIVLNVDLVESLFRNRPGLERTAIGHEAGHGCYHLEHGRLHQLDLGIGKANDFTSDVSTFDDRLEEVIAQRGPTGDDWWREWQAHTFMRHVLMPRKLLQPLLRETDTRHWHELYKLRKHCDVTISALVVHLAKLGIIRIDETGYIRNSRPNGRGQQSLRFR